MAKRDKNRSFKDWEDDWSEYSRENLDRKKNMDRRKKRLEKRDMKEEEDE